MTEIGNGEAFDEDSAVTGVACSGEATAVKAAVARACVNVRRFMRLS
jgi:ribosomal protein S9